MAKSKDQIIKEIEKYIREKGAIGIFWGYGSWYCGITADIKANKTRHKNPEKYKCFRGSTPKIVREIEKHFINLGMDGDVGGGTDVTHLYVF